MSKKNVSIETDIEDLKALMDNVIVQISFISVKQNVFQSMVLDIYGETMPEINANTIYTNYVNAIEEELDKAINSLGEIIFDQKTFLLRQKFSFLSSIQHMKRDERYIDSLND